MSDRRTVKRVGIVFSGGPAPAANAVISAAALGLLNEGVSVIGFLDGFEHLHTWTPERELVCGRDYVCLTQHEVSEIRNRKDIILRTSRTDPGELVRGPEDLADSARNATLRAVCGAVASLELDGLITIGGDGTLMSANYLMRVQEQIEGVRPFGVIHIPKTIDNDYYGIDWTFGFNSAADYAGKEIRNVGADARSTGSWWVLEIQGRKAGWLTYAAGIAGEATRMISVEDCVDGVFDLDRTAREIVDLMLARREDGRRYGIVCVSEGLAEHLAPGQAPAMGTDERGDPVLGTVEVGELLAKAVEREFSGRCAERIRVRSKQIGYETRCTEPVAFDVLLACQLGAGAARMMVAGATGRMVSVRDQFELREVPFDELIDPATMRTRLRMIDPDSDFYRLARSLEYQQLAQDDGICE